MRLTKGKGCGSTNTGAMEMSGQAQRPPKKRGRVVNDVGQFGARSAVMPAPTDNTSVPYRSKPGATTSPSNTIYKGIKEEPRPRVQGGTPRGHGNRTPRP